MEIGLLLALVAACVGVGLMLYGGSARRRRLQSQDPLRDLQYEHAKVAATPQGLVRELEVRLYDYGRDVEARIETQLVVLDRLILDADREISRLEALLAESRQDLPGDRPLSRYEQQRCFALHEAGFTVEEMARCMNTTEAEVRTALDEWQRPDRQAA